MKIISLKCICILFVSCLFISYAHADEDTYGDDRLIEYTEYDEDQHTGQGELDESLPDEPVEYDDGQPLEEER